MDLLRRSAILALLGAGCGPSVSVAEGGDSDSQGRTDATGSPSTSAGDPASTTGNPPTPSTTATPTTASTTSTTSTTGEATSSSGPPDPCECDFLCDPDECNPDQPVFECDLYSQDCPQGDKCMPWANDGGNAWNATRCAPVAPNAGQAGAACSVEAAGTTGIDDCGVGLMCWGVDAVTLEGRCEAFCGVLGVCSDPDKACGSWNEGIVPVCVDRCDALAQDCALDEACVPADYYAWTCVPPATGAGSHASPCQHANDCGAGLSCIAATVPGCDSGELGGCCARLCDITTPNACPGQDLGEECIAVIPEGVAPGVSFEGVCILPPEGNVEFSRTIATRE